MDSFSKFIQLLSNKVDELNAAIDALEEERYHESGAKLAAFKKGSKRSFFYWLTRIKVPRIFQPEWHHDQSRIRLRTILEVGHIDSNQLAGELNLYVLNVAIHLERLKADRCVASKAEELRVLLNELRNVSAYGDKQ